MCNCFPSKLPLLLSPLLFTTKLLVSKLILLNMGGKRKESGQGLKVGHSIIIDDSNEDRSPPNRLPPHKKPATLSNIHSGPVGTPVLNLKAAKDTQKAK
ncbi:hypothetical protein IFR05_011936 [Cadophora sp. M221]|nr:hypothetical protein IFR05_011936 [Cadophora sp. M221]